MAVLLQDTFVGSAGDIDGRTPDTTFGSTTWVSDPGEPLNLNGTGSAVSADQSSVDMRGFADVGDGVTDYGNATGVTTTITFVIKTGASVTLGSLMHEGFLLGADIGGTYFECSLFGPDVGDGRPWQVNEIDDGDSNAVTTPAINTEYTGTYEIADGAQTLTFMGNTKTSAVTFATPSIGLNRISVKVGAGFQLLSIEASDNAAIPVTADLTAPMGTLKSYTGARATLTAPKGVLRSVAHDSTGERAFKGIAPMGQLVARTGATARMEAPMGTLVSSITVPISVRAELTGPAGSLVSSSTVGVLVQADLRLSRAGTLVATTGAQTGMAAPVGVLQAVATVGALARFAGSVPMGELSAMMTAGIVVRAELVAPMIRPAPRAAAQLVAPMGRLTAIASAVVEVTYEAYAVNLLPGEGMPHQVTRYTNFPFNQIVRFQGNYYGVAADGLYLLGGDTDYDASAPAKPAWSFHTGITDFGSRQVKGARETIVGGRLGPSVTASVSVGEAADQTYSAAIVAGFGAKNYRVKYGKGLNARYWSFGFADPAGSDVNIDTLEFDVRETSRKL